MNLNMYINRIQATGAVLEPTPTTTQHKAEGLTKHQAFRIKDTSIELEVMWFSHQQYHQNAIETVGASAWVSGYYWLPSSSGGALLFARAPLTAESEAFQIDAIAGAFAGGE